ncbi:MAG: hypothetical protein ACK5PR_02655, partial [bacterium]
LRLSSLFLFHLLSDSSGSSPLTVANGQLMCRGRNDPQPVEIVGEKIPLDILDGSGYGAAVAQFHVPPRTAGLLGE